MSAGEVKTFKVTGGAAEDYASQLTGGRKRRSTRRRAASGPIQQSGGAGSLGVGVVAPSIPPQVKLAQTPNAAPPNAPFTQDMKPIVPIGGGGVKKEQKEHSVKPKVILAPSKKTKHTNKVLLAPPRRRMGHSHATRKIRVGLNGMRRRLTRAKKISEDSEKKGVEEIRRTLVDAKLIKDGSKVPESLMRTMYKDYLLLKDRAL